MSKCVAKTAAGIQCAHTATRTIGILDLCITHENLYNEYEEHSGTRSAIERILEGKTFAMQRIACDEQLSMIPTRNIDGE